MRFEGERRTATASNAEHAENAKPDNSALPGHGNIKVCRSRLPQRPRRQMRCAVTVRLEATGDEATPWGGV